MKSSGAPGAAVDVELVKAAAQAWYAHSGNPRPSRTSAADNVDHDHGIGGVRRAAARYSPSRFKLEADAAAAAPPPSGTSWDFTQSLWDTYELVAVAQKIESSLLITDKPQPRYAAKEGAAARGGGKRARQSKRSLRSLLFRSSPRRFQESST